jgi:hypothetical protein
MTPTEDQWFATAIHEMGHVISLLHFGCKFRDVRIWEDEGKVSGQVRDPNTTDLFATSIMCMAGPIAKQRLTGISWDEQSGAWDDIDKARDLLSRTGMDGLGIHSILPFTTMMIEHNWPLIVFLAHHLVEHKLLSYDQVFRLMEDAVDHAHGALGSHFASC